MQILRWVTSGCGAVILGLSPHAQAGTEPLFGNLPSWVIDAGALPVSSTADGIILLDRQQKIEGSQSLSYTDIAVRAASAEQLVSLGSLALAWHPEKGDLTVHRIQILRGTEVIDVMKGGPKFTVLRREQNLEQLAINGILTATMQVEGLKIGDVVRLTTTISFTDPALGGGIQVAQPLILDTAKVARGTVRLIWPQAQPLKWRVTPATAAVNVTKKDGFNEVSIAQPLGKQPDLPTDAPLRFTPPPLLEASSFASWNDVSKAAALLYPARGLITAGSPLGLRVAAIAAQSSDANIRTAAALRLVQDEVRYLFNGQTEGNYVPQTPAQTWEKRYGDCKAKSYLLVAILSELGIAAQPALVHSQWGDLLMSRLPSMSAFDHVIVRAVIDGKTLWLDGTRIGTRLVDLRDPPPFRYALPLSSGGSVLEPIVYAAPARPMIKTEREIDATAGLSLPKLYKIRIELHNDQVFYLRQAQSGLDGKKLEEVIDKVVEVYMGDTLIAARSLAFDDDAATAVITANGIANLKWTKQDDGRKLTVGSSLSDWEIEVDRGRPAWKEMAASTSFPNFYSDRYVIRLPAGKAGFSLENPKAVAGQFGGYDISVSTRFDGTMFEMTDSWKTSVLEIPAAALASEREKLARAKAGDIAIVAPADYPPSWRETRGARGTAKLKPLNAVYAADIAKSPGETLPYINRARFLAGIGDTAAAIADLTKVIALAPDVDTYLWRASLYGAADSKRALADIEAARAIDPTSAAAVSQLVNIYFHQERYDAAATAIDDILPLHTDNMGLRVLRAEALARAGRGADAVAAMNKANLEKPGNPSLLNGRCWVRAIANIELHLALKDCTKAIELSENPAGMLDSRGLVYLRLARFEDAITDFDAALRINPAETQTIYVRGVARVLAGDTPGGQADIRDAQIMEPDIAIGYARMGIKPTR